MDQEFALSITLAKLLGPLFLVIGVGALFNRDYYQKMIAEFLRNSGLYYFSGATALVVGLAIVIHHNIWSADWRSIITVIGWISIFRGAVRLLLPAAGSRFATSFTSSFWPIGLGVILIIIVGGVLTYFGYVS